MGYLSTRVRQMLGSHPSNLTVFVYKKGSDPTEPQAADCPVSTAEQGKHLCEQFIRFREVERVELVDTEHGEVIYARGYRASPEKSVKARNKKEATQAALFGEGG